MDFKNIREPLLQLAPMAGYSDSAMRAVCHAQGADYSVTEMISAKAVTYKDKKTFSMAKIRPTEGAVGLQLFGNDPSVMAEAAGLISRGYCGLPGEPEKGEEEYLAPVAIDINCGCPVKKIFGNGEGSALMGRPELIRDIVKATVCATVLPVTVKIRAGIDGDSINAVECALAAEEGGASLVCVHGRTREQMYSGLADRAIIARVKSALRIPVLANGDIRCPEDGLAMLAETGADGLAVGRGAVGNPFIFAGLRAILAGRESVTPTLADRIETALYQLRLSVEDKGEAVAVNECRKQIGEYLHGYRGSATLRGIINKCQRYCEVESAMIEYRRNYECQ